jgi:hypothetical protein
MPMSRAVICSTMRAFCSGPPSIGTDAGNFCCELAGELRGVGIVAADDHVAVERSVAVEQFGGHIVEGRNQAHSFGHEFGGLLRGRALPDADGARGASAHAGRERNRGVDEDAAVGHCGFELLQQRSLTFEGHGQHQDVGGRAGGAVFHARNVGLRANFSVECAAARCARCASREPMMIDSPARAQRKREPHAGGACASDDGDGACA